MAEKREKVRESRSFPAVMTLQTTDVLHYSISKFTTVTTEKERRSGVPDLLKEVSVRRTVA